MAEIRKKSGSAGPRNAQVENITGAFPEFHSRFNYLVAVVFLIFCTQPALTVITSIEVDHKSNIAAFLVQFVAYGVVLAAIGRKWWALVRQLFSKRMLWIALLTGLALISAAWSDSPGLTFRRSLVLLLTELVAIYFATSLSYRQQFRVMSTTLLILLVLSLMAVAVYPAYGTMPSSMDAKLTGNWRGVFPHKNTLGRYASLGAIIFAFNWLAERRKRWILAFLLALVMLAGSKSMTSIAVTTAVLISLPFFRFLRGRWFYSALALTCAVFAGVFWYVFHNFYSVVDMMGRDVTLSRRVPLWFAGIIVGLRKNPWLEFGWSSFWRDGGDATTVWKMAQWRAPEIHNGYLELWLSLGFLGLICFGVCHLLTTSRAIRLQRLTRSFEALWPLAFLLYFTLVNLTESVGVSQNSLIWILYVMVVYQVYEVVVRPRALAAAKSHAIVTDASATLNASSAIRWAKKHAKAEGTT
jgi:exopolysaccharide production protein ExoQ